MEVNIYQGATLLKDKGYCLNNRAYIPSDALRSYSGILGQNTVFLNSPLAGKVICLALLDSGEGSTRSPRIQRFMDLCTASGAKIHFYDGGGFPAGDIILAIETGVNQTGLRYMGVKLRSRPLARRIAANIKQGLKLAYLPDPAPFDKPHYNFKLRIRSRLFTPAVAVQWPEDFELGPWLFASLMEHFSGGSMEVAALLPEIALPEPPSIPVPAAESPALTAAEPAVAAIPFPAPPLPLPSPIPPLPITGPRRVASMSPAAYPDFSPTFTVKKLKKKPFY